MLHNFPINPGKEISNAFLERGITDFSSALIYVQDLPYGRNTDRGNPILVLKEQAGTGRNMQYKTYTYKIIG